MPKKNRSPINLVKIATSLANQQALWEPLVSYDPVARYYVRLAHEKPPGGTWKGLFQPFRDKADIGVDMDGFVTIRSRRELVRGISRYNKNLSGMPPELFRSHREGCPTAPDDERLGVRVLVQPWPDSGLGRRLQNDRNIGATRQLLVVLSPVLAILTAIGAINRECVHRPTIDHIGSGLGTVRRTFPSLA